MRPTLTAVVLAGSLLASSVGQPALWDQLWGFVSSLWSDSAEAGCGFDPNGCPTNDAGIGFDPNGLTSDEGLIFDPSG